jgi:hypothetical protein
LLLNHRYFQLFKIILQFISTASRSLAVAVSSLSRYYTRLLHEKRWSSGCVIVTTSTMYNAVKHAVRSVPHLILRRFQ